MKKICIYTLLALVMIACRDNTAKTSATEITATQTAESAVKANINFDSDPVAQSHRTVLTEKYKELDINFASHYVVVTWGCGSGCVTGAMVDTRDGFVYPMPKDKEWGGNGTYIESTKESSTLLTVAVARSSTGETEETRKYWEWDEDLKEFTFQKVESVLVTGNE